MFYCFRIPMKKLIFLIITLISLNSFSQKDYTRYYNSWRLGLNLGGAWQTADYRSCWGMAGGITLEKGFHENATNIFSFAIRARYLGANTYGMDYNRNYDVKSNDAYNGKYDPKINYVDSVSVARQYIYDNYKMKLDEGSLELQITFNRLRERTHVLFNLWGGIGFTAYQTKSDLLDGAGKKYDFSLIDSTGNKTKTLNSYNTLIDKKYESYAYGSKAGKLYTFSPSLGVGLGYQFSPGFSMLWEYKVTFPQGTNADLLDGKLGANGDFFGSNDYYHYTGLNLLFTLRGKKKTKTTPSKDETVYTNTVAPTQTVVAPTNSVTTPPPTNTVVASTPPSVTEPKPIISFITPPVNGHVVTLAPYKISAQILNINSAAQIQFKFNGVAYSNFNYNAQTHIVEYNATLNNGNNSIQIIATNNSGQDNESTTVIYDQPKVAVNPPVVSYINPVQAGYVSSTSTYSVKAQVLNVTSQNQISIYYNGISTPFTYNATTKQVLFGVNLNAGSNSVSITANNDGGEDTKTTTIIYNEPKALINPPVVSFINPALSGEVVSTSTYVVKAQVLNVTTQNQISVYYNGASIPFVYNPTTQKVAFTANLYMGPNTVTITATNSAGQDTKNTNVVYRLVKVLGAPPVVNYIIPASQINATDMAAYNFKLGVLNVASKSDIAVVYNGALQTNFNYTTSVKEMFFHANLIVGDNTLIVKATNAYGVDTKTINVNYTPHADLKTPPVVTITNPINVTTTSNVNYNFKATVANMPNNSGLQVRFNGVPVLNYTYDGFNLSYNAILVPGNNTFDVTATNNDGTDTKTANVTYKVKAAPVLPIVNLMIPVSVSNATDVLNYNFKLAVFNVSSSADIEVLFNGVPQNNFSYNVNTKELVFATNLVVGNNTLNVKGTNQFGSDSKQIIVVYTPHVEIKTPPLINFVTPVNGSGSASSNNYNYLATISNIENVSGISAKFNGITISNFTYDGFNFGYSAILNTGANSLEISATNQDGSDIKTAIVTYKPKPLPKPPVVSIIDPTGNPGVSTSPYNFSFSATNVTKNQIQITLNGTTITQFNFIGTNGSFASNLINGLNTLVVKATNVDGTDSKTETVFFKGQVSNVDSSSTSDPKSTGTASTTTGNRTEVICHKSATAAPVTITIPSNLLPFHLSHGDTQGACPAKADTIITSPVKPRTIPVRDNNKGEAQDSTQKQTPINTPRRPH